MKHLLLLFLLFPAMYSCASDGSRMHQTETMSLQAQKFLSLNTPPVFDSPLTPETVAPIREAQRAASATERDALHRTLLASMEKEMIGGVPVAVLVPKNIAGGLAMIDERISPILPGIAIATSLTPPLSACGLCLAFGAYEGAGNAFILFSANFLAILFVASLIFVFTGFVRGRVGDYAYLFAKAYKSQGKKMSGRVP